MKWKLDFWILSAVVWSGEKHLLHELFGVIYAAFECIHLGLLHWHKWVTNYALIMCLFLHISLISLVLSGNIWLCFMEQVNDPITPGPMGYLWNLRCPRLLWFGFSLLLSANPALLFDTGKKASNTNKSETLNKSRKDQTHARCRAADVEALLTCAALSKIIIIIIMYSYGNATDTFNS